MFSNYFTPQKYSALSKLSAPLKSSARSRYFAPIKCLAAMTALAVGVGPVYAQALVEISPDETVLVERYVREIPAPPPIVEEHMTLRPGSVIPDGVPLSPFEKAPSLRQYAFFVSVDHKIVVADKQSRVVVRILDQTH